MRVVGHLALAGPQVYADVRTIGLDSRSSPRWRTRAISSAPHTSRRWVMVALADSPASFHPSKAAIMIAVRQGW